MKACRLCGSVESLTRHHLTRRGDPLNVGRTSTVVLCRTCHDRFHGGPPASRRAAWDELYAVLTDDEKALRDHPERVVELWETKEARS